MKIDSNKRVLEALKNWAINEKGFCVEDYDVTNRPLVGTIIDKEGYRHEVFMPDSVALGANEGCLAAKDVRTGELLQEFTSNYLSQQKGMKVSAKKFEVNSKEDFNEVLNRLRGENKSKSDTNFGNEIEKMDKIIEIIKAAAPNEKEAQRALRPLMSLRKLAVLAKDLENGKAELDASTPNSILFLKCMRDDQLKEPCDLGELQVGQFFFDDNHVLFLTVGLEKGKLNEDYINTVVVSGDAKDLYRGKPIKMPLSEAVIPLNTGFSI
ncbi:hypothetical protein VCR15J2_390060 [Vibrio coralliirubri]|uniref:hypothetical protein n=1 Tax=Vibrio coralliirubri TaxID=1516159 RepID=UPI00063A5FF3|nr:hypothetical protein [Vibrio coralliirubri]CDT53343.1 hypothetical protein VCR15J2_390060 [Vibrio coralliirubri]